jgi:uncharacterized protein with NRDE domain
LLSKASQFSGFNLILGDPQGLYYYGNRDGRIRTLKPGLYGLSNRLLDTDWPKVRVGKSRLADSLEPGNVGSSRIDAQSLIALLQNQEKVPDSQLPQTGVGIEMERMLAPAFITSHDYGTRSSSVVLIRRNDQVDFREISWAPGSSAPHPAQDRRFSFTIRAS